MSKLWLIVKREYLTRVRRRTFILATLLTPLAFAFFFIIVAVIFSYESGTKRKIAFIDNGGITQGNTFTDAEDGSLYFVKSSQPLEELKEEVLRGTYDGILVIPPISNIKHKHFDVKFYTDKQLGLDDELALAAKIKDKVRDFKIKALNLDSEEINALQTQVSLTTQTVSGGEKESSQFSSAIGAAVGGIMGVIMYMTVFIYGMMIMRSVMEEKTNRIVEVMISSVKPFQLMLGKIIGVGAVGLTQVAIWAVLIPSASVLVNLIFGIDSGSLNELETAGANVDITPEDAQAIVARVMSELGAINWWLILPLFVFYFLGGYFLYSSLFAAVGSAMGDDLGEGQSLTIPITIPVLIAFYIMIVAVRAPESNLAVWSSIFPLFSPIVMPARLAFNPPFWEIALSVTVLAATSIFFVWLSARIYRIGILMYGKKVGFREIGKWLFYKD